MGEEPSRDNFSWLFNPLYTIRPHPTLTPFL
ncbi:hypothetical protein Mesop_3624 [Mesorhizobium opportunistum WSM2075]|uniref:Uncharacterized protein n=1 Tax=Mesorhizobium opportunistum (strain LMG 24607 / HAMBI 3007 / WSM2075) TaxID=536019 RepID=F7YH44_MESOW|nr:hypothetical protein Mesop_3624 [Mesorhizobium opportunistum WSM2075]